MPAFIWNKYNNQMKAFHLHGIILNILSYSYYNYVNILYYNRSSYIINNKSNERGLSIFITQSK